MIKVLIVDDHAVLRQGLRLILREASDLNVVGEAASGMEAVERTKILAPDIVLLDIQLPDISGVEVARQIRSVRPEARILMLTVSDRSDDLLGALKAGARGYLLKNASAEEVLEAIRRVAAGEAVLPPELTARLIDELAKPEPTSETLTDREIEVLQYLAQGFGNKEIAAALAISENTVKTHVRHILAKLNVRSRAEAAAYAVRTGLVNEK